ncbi:MAG: bifunctional adenosylcobinamide kinase/adenosylcobinamide-phosphate guanylyltransferase [Lachnospiraceae bacterium]|nr:bifunctional adenosylcobinamide kinase/adenosylcobinamide-phosphate guanylyltransferase [Lachnospiraceae bacterium]
MIQLVIGGPDSGKSLLAEELTASVNAEHVYYIATMRVLDDDGRKRIQRHRAQRAGKGFITLEIETDIEKALRLMDMPLESVCLLECVANLVGNLLYGKTGRITDQTDDAIIESVLSKIRHLSEGVRELVVVTSEYAPDDADDRETVRYKKLLHSVNERLSVLADRVHRTAS